MDTQKVNSPAKKIIIMISEHNIYRSPGFIKTVMPMPLLKRITISADAKSRSGFTLIELIVVILIIAILAAFVAPKLIHRADEAKVTEAKIQIKNFETALRLFKMDNGFYPSTGQGLEALITPPATGEIPENYRPGGYLEKRVLPSDPWGNAYMYISPGMQGDYDIISFGADGKEGGEKYNADIINWDI